MSDMMGMDQEVMFEAFETMLCQSLEILINVEPNAEQFLRIQSELALSNQWDFLNYLVTDSKNEQRCAVRMIGIQIWNNTPLPSLGYKLKPLPKIQRNDPCLCGSQKKFKQCCLRFNLSDTPMITEEMVMHYLLRVISKTGLKQVWQHISHPLLGFIAGEWLKTSEELAERALLMLDPIFKQDDAKLSERDELVLDSMLDLCSALGKPRKKMMLLKRIMQHPNKTLQAAALHRQCCIFSDEGNYKDAWAIFQQAQRVDPNNPGLSHLEILLLMQQGKIEQMHQRGQYWIKRLSKQNRQGQYDQLIETIHEMITDAPTAMGKLIEYDVEGASRLIAWLKRAAKNPPKPVEVLTTCDDISILEPRNKTLQGLHCRWNEFFMKEDDPWANPEGWLAMLEKYPELAGSIFILDDLVDFVGQLDTPNPQLTFEPLMTLGMLQLKAVLPRTLEKPLEWGYMNNRPALRLLGFLASSMNDLGDDDMAISLWEWLLDLDPVDRMGVRSLLMNVYLENQSYKTAKALGEKYLDDGNVNVCYGHALALFCLDERERANARLLACVQQAPKVLMALRRKTMKQPQLSEYGFVTVGGDDEAWLYRNTARQTWLDAKGAMSWLKQVKVS